MNTNEKIKELQEKLKKLEKRFNKLYKQINGDPKTKEFLGLRFQSNGAWAIHYSTVRLTIATFVITTCLTITGFQWEKPSPSIIVAVAIIGLMGFTVFYWSTYGTLKMMQNQLEKIKKPRTLQSLWGYDLPSYIIGVFIIAYAIIVLCVWMPKL